MATDVWFSLQFTLFNIWVSCQHFKIGILSSMIRNFCYPASYTLTWKQLDRMEVSLIGEARDLSLLMLSPSHHHSLTLPGWPLSVPPFNSYSKLWALSSTKFPKKKPSLNIFFDHICVVQFARLSHSGFPYPCSKCCLYFGLIPSGITKQYFIVWGSLFWLTTEMLGEIQYLSLASFCLSHWVSLTTIFLSIPFSRDESFSQALRTSVSRDKNWFPLWNSIQTAIS